MYRYIYTFIFFITILVSCSDANRRSENADNYTEMPNRDECRDFINSTLIYIKKHPGEIHKENYRRVASCYYKLRHLDRTIEYLDKALQYGDDEEVHVLKLAVLGFLGEKSAGDALAEYMSERYPDSKEVKIGIARHYQEYKDYENSLRLLKELVETGEADEAVYNMMGFVYIQTEEYEAAISALEKTLETDPEYAIAWNNLGFAYHKIGDNELGKQYVRKSLDYDASNSYSYYNLGLISIDDRDTTTACDNLYLAREYEFSLEHGNAVDSLIAIYCD